MLERLSCYSTYMRILGIDPGTAIVGYGLIDYRGGVSKAEEYGCIATDKKFPPSQRLKQIYEHLSQLLNTTKPDIVAVEKLYFNTNITTGIAVSQARGVILLAIEQQDIPLAEYTPLQVKMAVCGYGVAKKPQVQQMTQMMLKLKSIPRPDDAADALAIALCHTNSSITLSKQL